MATTKQKRLIDKIIENNGNVSKSMVEVGYSPATATNPQFVTRSKGFQEAAAEAGLTPSFLTEALVSDIKAKPHRRKAELELGFKVLGIANEPGTGSTYNTFIQQNNINPNTPEAKELVDATLDILMERSKRQP